jgi:murein DD-endopeptidase MepM/ murein hydrolase activator NlpD
VNKSFLTYIIFLLVISPLTQVFAQGSKKNAPDSVMVGGRMVLLFSNHTWMYADEALKLRKYDSLFNNNWEKKEIFSYLKEKKNSLDSQFVNLLENGDTFVFPLKTFRFLRGYKSYHSGLDLGTAAGDSIFCVFSGKVRYAEHHRNGYGKLVIVRHYSGLETYYAHLSKILVEPDEYIAAGQCLGLVGATGRATTNHLHFETRYRDRPFDPLRIISLENKSLTADTLLLCDSFFGGATSGTISGGSEPPTGEGQRTHVIRKGDTLYALARKYGTTVEELCRINNISRQAVLRVGKKLRID